MLSSDGRSTRAFPGPEHYSVLQKWNLHAAPYHFLNP